MNVRGELSSPDPLDSFPPLRVRESDGASDDSEFERYCSANSVMGTPSTSMSMCSAVTLFNDFSDCDFASSAEGFESFSLGKGTTEANCAGNRRRSLRYGSSGLELYGDCSEELALTALDSSELIGFNRIEEPNGNGEVSAGEGGVNGFEFQIDKREEEEEEEEEELEELSEGDDSMYNYDSDGNGDGGKEIYLTENMGYCEEREVRNENSLFMNTSVAYGSRDLDDFLLQNGPVSVMSDLFHSQRKKNDTLNPGSGQKEQGKNVKDMVIVNEVEETKDIDYSNAVEKVKDREVLMASYLEESSAPINSPSSVKMPIRVSGDLASCPEVSSVTEVDEVHLDLPEKEAPRNMGLGVNGCGSMEKGNVNSEEAIAGFDAPGVKSELDDSMFRFDHISDDSQFHKSSSNPSSHLKNVIAKSFECVEPIAQLSDSGMRKTLESSPTSTNLLEKSPVVSKTEDFELNEFYDEVVQEMEEILLESVDSPGARLSMGNRLVEPQFSMPSRDGGLTASTSSTDDTYLLVQRPRRIDRIEVVGARQKKGDVSFSERLVGVKEYTVYIIKVWSGKDQWEVERRYRDFFTLYRCMKALFNEQGGKLPLPWSSVEKETQIFRSASPDIIVKRSVLIQECLQSFIHSRFSPPRALTWFLSHQDSYPISPVSNVQDSQSSFTGWQNFRNISNLGKTISLIVEIPPNKSIKQLLEAQHHTCAGCHKHFDNGRTLIWDFVQTFGWGKPRLCEYTGQLFCSSCHTNETAVLPARVLHHWDFTHYHVSQLAKSYLDSIYEQPMLCVTAVNPFLLSKVPALLHIMSIRKKIGIMIPYVRCPFRRAINRGLGNRRYLLESNDFFALRDLIDLSRGVFAALPVMVETVSRKILEHITDQCLVCCDVGDPCNARQDCSDPSSLIFPFQEEEIERCKACQLVFHKRCFRKLGNCPCGAQLRLKETRSFINRVSQRGGGETRGSFDLLGRGLTSGLSQKFLSGFFTTEKPDKTKDHKDENIILMGSLPTTSL
ncbi:hypothetical protein V8G54_007355 [Vigna mungo]|uniref:PX domain-containing protein n=1 Tax=Vigna mungo TaxID=3915 RepID=A0AAQ3P581_VIGMU